MDDFQIYLPKTIDVMGITIKMSVQMVHLPMERKSPLFVIHSKTNSISFLSLVGYE